MEHRVSPEIRDLNCLTEENEVQYALRRALKMPSGTREVLGLSKRGSKHVIVVTNQEDADRPEKLGGLKIGFMLSY